jgi:hypothetical protein
MSTPPITKVKALSSELALIPGTPLPEVEPPAKLVPAKAARIAIVPPSFFSEFRTLRVPGAIVWTMAASSQFIQHKGY